MQAGDRGCAAAYPGGGYPEETYGGRDPVRDGDPGAADATEEVRDGEVVALAIRQKDGMGQGVTAETELSEGQKNTGNRR